MQQRVQSGSGEALLFTINRRDVTGKADVISSSKWIFVNRKNNFKSSEKAKLCKFLNQRA